MRTIWAWVRGPPQLHISEAWGRLIGNSVNYLITGTGQPNARSPLAVIQID